MALLPSKKVIRLVIILVVITVCLLWFVGHQNRSRREALRDQYLKEFLAKQKNIEAVAVGSLQKNEFVASPIEKSSPVRVLASTPSSIEQLHTYGLEVIKALKPLEIPRGSEPQAVMDAVDKNDPSLLKPVVESRIYHQSATQNLAQIIVPKELAEQHKKIIDQLNFLSSILENMAKAIEQPGPALNNSQSFVTNYEVFLKQLDTLTQTLVKNGVKFTPQEKLKIFISYI